MKEKHASAIRWAKDEQRQAAERAKAVRRNPIDSAAINEGALEIFRALPQS